MCDVLNLSAPGTKRDCQVSVQNRGANLGHRQRELFVSTRFLAGWVGDGELLAAEGGEEALEFPEVVEGDVEVDGAFAPVFSDGYVGRQDIAQNFLSIAQFGA